MLLSYLSHAVRDVPLSFFLSSGRRELEDAAMSCSSFSRKEREKSSRPSGSDKARGWCSGSRGEEAEKEFAFCGGKSQREREGEEYEMIVDEEALDERGRNERGQQMNRKKFLGEREEGKQESRDDREEDDDEEVEEVFAREDEEDEREGAREGATRNKGRRSSEEEEEKRMMLSGRLQLLQVFPNLGPIVDCCAADVEGIGQKVVRRSKEDHLMIFISSSISGVCTLEWCMYVYVCMYECILLERISVYTHILFVHTREL